MSQSIIEHDLGLRLRDADVVGMLGTRNRFRLSAFYDDNIAEILRFADEGGNITFDQALSIIEGDVTRARIDEVHFSSDSGRASLPWTDFVKLGRPTYIQRTTEYVPIN